MNDDNQKNIKKTPAGAHLNAYQQASLLGQEAGLRPLVRVATAPQNIPVERQATQSRRGKRQHNRPEGDIISPRDEIIFEHTTRGAFRQVTAMHVPTLTEISSVGSKHASEFDMEQLALAKLRFMLRKKFGNPA